MNTLVAVGSSAGLGVVLSPDTVAVLRSIQCVLALFAVFCVIQMIRALMSTKHQSNLDKTNNAKNDSKRNKPECETLHIASRNLLLTRDDDHKLGHQSGLLCWTPNRLRAIFGLNLVKLLNYLMRSRIHKTQTTPNGQKLSHGADNANREIAGGVQ